MMIIMISLVELSDEARITLNESRECKLPDGCRIDAFHVIDNLYVREYLSARDLNGFICDVKNNQNHFDGFNDKLAQTYLKSSCRNQRNVTSNFDLRFSGDLDTKLDENLNLKGILSFMNRLLPGFTIHLTNVRGFSVDLNIERPVMNPKSGVLIKIGSIKFIRSNIDFYVRGKLIKSCEDLVSSSFSQSSRSWSPNSIFQMTPRDQKDEIFFINCRFR